MSTPGTQVFYNNIYVIIIAKTSVHIYIYIYMNK